MTSSIAVKERLHVLSGRIEVCYSVAFTRRGVQDWKVQLFRFGCDFQKQVLHHFDHLMNSCLRAVYLVYDNHRRDI